MILIIDNYDSFTFNIVQYLGELGEAVMVHRNDELSIDEISALSPQAIVISPGPCTPDQAGISLALVRHFAGRRNSFSSTARDETTYTGAAACSQTIRRR